MDGGSLAGLGDSDNLIGVPGGHQVGRTERVGLSAKLVRPAATCGPFQLAANAARSLR